MNQLSFRGNPFSFVLKPINDPDIAIYTDASLKIGIGAYSLDGRCIQCNWNQINLHNPDSKDIQWRELSAIYVMIKSIEKSLYLVFLFIRIMNRCSYVD